MDTQRLGILRGKVALSGHGWKAQIAIIEQAFRAVYDEGFAQRDPASGHSQSTGLRNPGKKCRRLRLRRIPDILKAYTTPRA